MAENLDWKFSGLNFRDSVNNPLDTTNAIQAAYYNYDENTYGADGNKYGLLYNWYAVDYLNQHSEELGVPEGWHVPSSAEYTTLIITCGENPGTKLKSTSSWLSGAGIDYYGFNALPGGLWANQFNGSVGYISVFFLSDLDDNRPNAWDVNTGPNTTQSTTYKTYCLSVRLVKTLS